MRTRRVAGCFFLLSLCCATFAVEIRTPLEDANALQRQIHSVVERSCGSVFAVTAFLDDTSDPALFEKSIPTTAFVQVSERAQRSCGSAFAIDGQGHLLTNEHVVSGAKSVWITTDKGDTLPALVVASDPRGDLAVLKIPVRTTSLAFGGAEYPGRGDVVVAIGNPGGMSISGEMAASVGNVSAVGRSLPTLSAREHRFYGDLLQITTPISTGSSGGPLLDLSGNCVGVVCAVVPNSGAEPNIGFAIPLSREIVSRIERLKQGQESAYGFLGVNVSPVTEDTIGVAAAGTSKAETSEFVLTAQATPRGARVDKVDAGTPAFGVLDAGDVILRFGERQVASDIDFIRFAGACDIDQDISISILRDGKPMDLSLRPRRRALPIEPITAKSQYLAWAGIAFANDERGARVLNVDDCAESPFKAGNIVKSVNDQPIHDLSDLLTALHANAGTSLKIELDGED